MGKTSRKTKAKKSDFNKVKLKVGKKKPLPNNVTKTDFKSQSIYIGEQYKNVTANKKTLTTLSGAKEELKSLLNSIRHTSPTRRYHALLRIQEIMVALMDNPCNIGQSIMDMIEKVARTLYDNDTEVRKALLGLYSVIFKKLTPAMVVHHFDLLIKHLHCGLNDLSRGIQLDALKALDLMLDHYSTLFNVQDCFEIANTFLNLISMQGSGSKRVLSVQNSKKQTDIEWCHTIFVQLHRLLVASNPQKPRSYANPKREPAFHYWNSWKPLYKILFPSKYYKSRIKDIQKRKESERPDFEKLKSFAKDVFGLLKQGWQLVTTWDEENIREDTTAVMHMVVQITIQLVEYLTRSASEKSVISFVKKELGGDFDTIFFSRFPLESDALDLYGGGQPKKKRFRRDKEEGQRKSVRRNISLVNVSICKLYTLVTGDGGGRESGKMMEAVSEFVCDFLLTTPISLLTHKRDDGGGDLLQQTLDVCDRLVHFSYSCDPDLHRYQPGTISQQIANVVVDLHHKHRNTKNGLPFIHFLHKNYEQDYIVPGRDDDFYKFISGIADQLMDDFKIMRKSPRVKANGGAECFRANLEDVTYRHSDFVYRIWHHAEIKADPAYCMTNQKVIEILGVMGHCGLLCSYEDKCYECHHIQSQVLALTINRKRKFSEEMIDALISYHVSPASHHHVTTSIINHVHRVTREDERLGDLDNERQICRFALYLLCSGSLKTHQGNSATLTNFEVQNLNSNAGYLLEFWNMYERTHKRGGPGGNGLKKLLMHLYSFFFDSGTCKMYPRSWIGPMRAWCFIHQQRLSYIDHFASWRDSVGDLLVRFFKLALSKPDFSEMIDLGLQVFNTHQRVQDVFLAKLIRDDDGLQIMCDLCKRSKSSVEMAKRSTFIVDLVTQLKPSAAEATSRNRFSDTILAILGK